MSHITHENRKPTVHFSYFQSIMTYEIIFWGNSIYRKLSILFKEEKIAGDISQVPYRKIFRKFTIPPFSSACLHSVELFVTYLTPSSLQGIDSEQKIKSL